MRSFGIIVVIVIFAVLISSLAIISVRDLMDYTTVRVVSFIKEQKATDFVAFQNKEGDEWVSIYRTVRFYLDVDGARGITDCFVEWFEPLYCSEIKKLYDLEPHK